jgi:hypothetical protein
MEILSPCPHWDKNNIVQFPIKGGKKSYHLNMSMQRILKMEKLL